jgi:hypothetical protein
VVVVTPVVVSAHHMQTARLDNPTLTEVEEVVGDLVDLTIGIELAREAPLDVDVEGVDAILVRRIDAYRDTESDVSEAVDDLPAILLQVDRRGHLLVQLPQHALDLDDVAVVEIDLDVDVALAQRLHRNPLSGLLADPVVGPSRITGLKWRGHPVDEPGPPWGEGDG